MRPALRLLLLSANIAALSACGPEPAAAQKPDTTIEDRAALDGVHPDFRSCMNLGGALEAEQEGYWGYTIRERDLRALAEAGFNAVRLPVRWDLRAGDAPPYTVEPALFERVDAVIAQALDAGLWVILDVHHFEPLMDDPESERPKLAGIWRQIAERYADRPERLVFELINEPHSAMDAAQVNAVNHELLKIVRETNPDRWVVFGTGQWGNLGGLLETRFPEDERVIATFHYYSPFDFTHQGAPWSDRRNRTGIEWGSEDERAELTADFEQAAAFADERNLPVFLGEFGVYGEVPDADRAEWISAVRAEAEAHDFSWCHWDFATTLRAYDLDDEAWIPQIRDALIGGDAAPVPGLRR